MCAFVVYIWHLLELTVSHLVQMGSIVVFYALNLLQMLAALDNSCKFHFLNSQQRNFSLLLVCSQCMGFFFFTLKFCMCMELYHFHYCTKFLWLIVISRKISFISSYDMIFLGHSSFHHLYTRDFDYCLLDYFLINNACSFTIINYYLKPLIL